MNKLAFMAGVFVGTFIGYMVTASLVWFAHPERPPEVPYREYDDGIQPWDTTGGSNQQPLVRTIIR